MSTPPSAAPNPAPSRRPIVIGLLGGIGSGKSSVARMLAALGAEWLDADAIAHSVLDEPEIVAAVCKRHGAATLLPGTPARVDRAALGRRVFDDRDALRHLEALLHPRVLELLEQRLDSLRQRGEVPAILLDVPLLLETGQLAARCDLLLFVDSPAEERLQRVVERRRWSPAELARREALQLPLAQKRAAADQVLVNDGNEAGLSERVRAWLSGAGGFEGLPRRKRG